jgi:SAM-dependent methyltransferase
MSKIELYTEKDKNYFSIIRWNIIDLIPEGNHRVLDVGCGNGANLKKLKELGKASEVFGIEINEDVAENLSQDLDKIIIGDIESIEPQFNENYFDYIIFADILEHLINPDKILNQYKKLLKDEGYIIGFFTKKEIKKMFQNENLKIIHMEPNFWWPIKIIDDGFFNILIKLLPFRSFFTIQYILKANKEP